MQQVALHSMVTVYVTGHYFVVHWLDNISLKYDTVQSKDIFLPMSHHTYLLECSVKLVSKERSLVLKLLQLVSFVQCAGLYTLKVM